MNTGKTLFAQFMDFLPWTTTSIAATSNRLYYPCTAVMNPPQTWKRVCLFATLS